MQHIIDIEQPARVDFYSEGAVIFCARKRLHGAGRPSKKKKNAECEGEEGIEE